MKPRDLRISRRSALLKLGLAAGAVASWPGAARSAELPHLSVQDPAALKLGYVEDAARVDGKKFKAFDPVQSCENCLQLDGEAGPAFRPCKLFPGKSVAVKGWCSGWTPEI